MCLVLTANVLPAATPSGAANDSPAKAYAAPSTATPRVAPTATALLDEAIRRLERPGTTSAKIRQQAELHGIRVVGNGTYLQRNDNRSLVRLDLKLQVNQQQATLQQVSDGLFLWTLRRSGTDTKLTRVEIRKVHEALAGGLQEAGLPTAGLTVGGLPELLRNLQSSVHWTTATPSKWSGLPVFVVSGTWQPAALARLLPEQRAAILAGQSPDLSKLSPDIPNQITLVLGADDFFPYRLEYQHLPDAATKLPALAQQSRPTNYLILEWFEVQRDLPIAPQLFQYQPADIPVQDETAAHIAALRAP